MRVLGEGSTISVGLDDDEEDALARRQQLLDLCAGAVVRPPRSSPSPPRCICTTRLSYCYMYCCCWPSVLV